MSPVLTVINTQIIQETVTLTTIATLENAVVGEMLKLALMLLKCSTLILLQETNVWEDQAKISITVPILTGGGNPLAPLVLLALFRTRAVTTIISSTHHLIHMSIGTVTILSQDTPNQLDLLLQTVHSMLEACLISLLCFLMKLTTTIILLAAQPKSLTLS